MKKPASSETDLSKLKVALVCDWLTEVGGAEKVLLAAHQMFPRAPIFTSQYRAKSAPVEFRSIDVRTGWLNILPRFFRKLISPLRYFYFKHLDLSRFDLVISICNAEAKNIKVHNSKTGARAFHISYLQGPPVQYYWGLYDEYLQNPGLGKLNFLARFGLKSLIKPLRRIDFRAAQKPDILLANSTYVAQEIQQFYHRDAEILFPNVDTEFIKAALEQISSADNQTIRDELFGGQQFYIISGRQNNWKRVDLAVSACIATRKNLLVAGYGADHHQLVDMAKGHENIRFLPRYDGAQEITRYFAAARAFIFPSLEPFGISPVEALAAGLPIIALKKGGALDMIKEGKNGVFFDQQTIDDLAKAIRKIEKMTFDRSSIQQSAQKFSTANFNKNLRIIVAKSLTKEQPGKS